MGLANSDHEGPDFVGRSAHELAKFAISWYKNDDKKAKNSARRGRAQLALQKRPRYRVGPPGLANRDTFREPGANPRCESPAVPEFSWYKNDDTFCPILANLGPRSRVSVCLCFFLINSGA